MKSQTRRVLGAGLIGLSLTAGLAACSTPTEEAAQAAETSETTEAAETSESTETTSGTEAGGSSSTYTDGEYTATGSYTTPGGQESVEVTLTLADDTVTAVTVTGSAEQGDSQRYQSEFIENIASQVVGVSIDELDVSKVAGSSLTSAGFNAAIDQILAEAQA